MDYKGLDTNLIKQAIQNEATPALANYWSLQYTSIFDKKVQYFSEKKLGCLNLTEHLTTDKKDLDHQELQNTISILIRFLDALVLDEKERNIRLSIINFEEFLKLTDTNSKIGIDYVGGLVSDFAYRASENLAHEKGAFLDFDLHSKDLRGADFEMWVDKQDNFKTGLELSRLYDANSVVNSPWMLVPRRNRSILDFPTEPKQWQNWSDKYMESKFQFKVSDDEQSPSKLEITKNNTQPEILDTNETLNLETSELPEPELLEKTSEEPVFSFEENQSTVFEHTSAEKDLDQISKNTEENDPTSMEESEEVVVGELVKITKEGSGKDKIFQVVDILDDQTYKLGGNEEDVLSQVWKKEDLVSVNLFDLLDDLNRSEKQTKRDLPLKDNKNTESATVDFDLPRAMVGALVLHNNKVLLEKQSQNWVLPAVEVSFNQIPEQAILDYLNVKFESEYKILDEIGSVMTQKTEDINSRNNIYNIFLLQALDTDLKLSQFNQTSETQYQFFDLDKVSKTDLMLKITLEKYNRRNNLLKIPDPSPTKDLVGDVIVVNGQPVELHNSVAEPEPANTVATETPEIKNLENPTNNSMNKYILKLQQIVSSNIFGELTLNLRYNSKGIQTVELSNLNLKPELQASIGTVLRLANYMLSKSISLPEVIEQIKNTDETLEINQLLNLLAVSLAEVPKSVNEIDQQQLY
jgi:hypothetical protein